jgi:dTMP kinase
VFGSLRDGLRFMGRTPLARGLLVGMLGALAAGGAVIALGRLFAETGAGRRRRGVRAAVRGHLPRHRRGRRARSAGARRPVPRRVFGPSITGSRRRAGLHVGRPNLFLAVVATLLVGAFAGVAYVVGITLLGLEVEDELRGRTFGLVQSLMRVDLLLVTATTPFIAGAIGRREGPFGLGINGVSVTLLVGGLLAMAVGIVSFRQMDDRPACRCAPTWPGACAAARRPGRTPAPSSRSRAARAPASPPSCGCCRSG